MKLVGRYSLNLLLALATVVLVLLAIQVWEMDRAARSMKSYGEVSLQNRLDEQLRTRARSMASLLAENVATPYLSYDMIGLYDVMLPARQSESVEAVWFFDTTGQIIHDASRTIDLYGKPVADLAPDVDLTTNVEQLLAREDNFASVAPVVAGDKVLGGIYVQLSRRGVTEPLRLMKREYDDIAAQRRKEGLYMTGAGAAVLFVLALLLSIVWARAMARPILALVNDTKRIVRGEYDVRADIDRADELGELGRAFHEMSRELQVKSQHIQYLAFHDPLTGLPNRNAFADALELYLRGDGEAAAGTVLFLDLNDFKRVNDTLGHAAGDQLLLELASRLRSALGSLGIADLQRGRDTIAPIARWGGDEFTIYLSGVNEKKEIAHVTNTLLESARAPFTIAGIEIVVGASIGVARYPQDADRVDALLNCADVAMYHAKQRGGIRAQAYSGEMRKEASGQLQMESELRHALERDQLVLKFQPLLDPISESVQGFEALLCWQHPTRGDIAQEEFMPIAESNGMSGEIGAWMITQALNLFAAGPAAEAQALELTLNVTSIHLPVDSIIEPLAAGLENTGIDSGRIIMEVTETRVFHDVLRTANLMQAIRALGVQTCIDAFGRGYSVISRFRHMPINAIKIDDTLIGGIVNSQDDENIVAAVIAAAHALGLRVGADGVESQAHLDALRRHGCDMVQGQWLAAPIDAGEIGAYLARSDVA